MSERKFRPRTVGSRLAERRTRARHRQHQAYAALENLSALTQALPDAIIVTDRSYTIIGWNDGAVALYGWTRPEVLGRSATAVIPGQFLNGDRAHAVKQLLTEQAWQDEVIQPRKDGTHLHIRASIAVVKGAAGQPIGFFGVNQDMTTRKQAEDALRQSEHRFSQAFHLSPAATSISQFSDGCYTDVNQAFLNLLGYQRDEVIGHSALELGIWADRQDRERAGHMLARQGAVRDMECLFRTKSGELRNGLVSIELVHIGSEPHILTIGYDITARKQVDEERARLLERERSARAAAEAAVRTRDEFLSVASHELKTPLTSIKSYTQMLLRPRGDDPIRRQRALQSIDMQADRLNTLLNDLLDVSRFEGGRLQLTLEVLDLAAFSQDVAAQAQILSDTHAIVVHSPPHSLLVQADPQRLRQVFVNLLANAIKYTPGGGTIDIGLSEEDGRALVSIHDPGIGIPLDELPHVFGRFYRARNASARNYGGLGLGLYISRQIVQRHGGEMWVSSAEGQGSTFSFSLPLAKQEEAG